MSSMYWFGLTLWLAHNFAGANAMDPFRQLPIAMNDQAARARAHGGVSIDSTWDCLGPFQIGTRELPWGADPLEQVGGFGSLIPDNSSSFLSALGRNGYVKWSKYNFTSDVDRTGYGYVQLNPAFPEIDWDILRDIYGWSASQYQTWVRGYFDIYSNHTRSYEIIADGIAEYSIEDHYVFGGDFYSYRRAPAIFQLAPGRHHIDIRLYRDVRAMGSTNNLILQAYLAIRAVPDDLIVDHTRFVVPDIVDGKLPTGLASVPLRNGATVALEILGITSDPDSWVVTSNGLSTLTNSQPLTLVPGQTRPLAFFIEQGEQSGTDLVFRVLYRRVGQSDTSSADVHYTLRQRTATQFHKYTYLVPSGTVSYAMLRAPDGPQDGARYPVMIFLHGANVDADSEQSLHVLDDTKNLTAWVIVPSGVTSWSGDDWHQWGWPDVEAAATTLPSWITNMRWKGPGLDKSPWLVAGHSNGGQAAWYALTHHPDRLRAAAPVAGYSSVQKYIPYTFWRNSDPRRFAVLNAALNSYHHELLISNAKTIPIAQEHGELDDNVPCYHSKNLFQLALENGCSATYYEVEGEGHVFDGMMTTNFLLNFYEKHLRSPESPPERLSNFTLVVANPADTGSKFGVSVQQLIDPGQLGTVQGRFDDFDLMLETSNVRFISLSDTLIRTYHIFVNGMTLSMDTGYNQSLSESWIKTTGSSGNVQFERAPVDGDLQERRGNQLGNLDAVLRTKGRFVIRSHHESLNPLALQISRNFFQYFAADTEIIDTQQPQPYAAGNMITIGIGSNVADQHLSENLKYSHPIRVTDSSLHIRDSYGNEKSYTAGKNNLGAIFLRPLDGEKLELVVWGTDLNGAATAARLLPLLSGAGQPDFVVLTTESRWRGIDGALAMGFFDSTWSTSPSSFLL